MNKQLGSCLVAVIAALASPQATGQQPVPPNLPPEVLQNMRGSAYGAAQACEQLYNAARQVPIRTRQGGETLAAILRLRDASRSFAKATTSSHWPRPDWLRSCSERLLDCWVYVDRILPTVPAPPTVLAEWRNAQGALVALYKTAAPYIGRPTGGPLPSALAGPPPTGQPGQPGVVRALPARP
jgi:hypothetical protein